MKKPYRGCATCNRVIHEDDADKDGNCNDCKVEDEPKRKSRAKRDDAE